MDKTMSKKWTVALATVASLFIMLILLLCLPQTALAQPGTLGTETPQVYCTYTDSEGQVVADPDHLAAGTYDVTFNIKGMEALSVVQVTASYDESVVFATAPKSLISDADTTFSSEGYVIGDGNLVFGFVSNNSDCSAVDSEGTALATITATFAEDCDPELGKITVSSNPNLTFALADYADGYDDEYANVETGVFDGYAGEIYYLDVDVSPVITAGGYTVSGSLVIMTDGSGTTGHNPVYGEYTVEVYSDADRTELVKETTSVTVTDGDSKTNEFVIDGLKPGTYYLSISSDYAITRNDITLIVGTEAIEAGEIPIIACDFATDSSITGADAIPIYGNAAATEKNYAYDLNGDGTITGADALIVYACATGRTYAPITIQ